MLQLNRLEFPNSFILIRYIILKGTKKIIVCTVMIRCLIIMCYELFQVTVDNQFKPIIELYVLVCMRA